MEHLAVMQVKLLLLRVIVGGMITHNHVKIIIAIRRRHLFVEHNQLARLDFMVVCGLVSQVEQHGNN
jgi:hypothetical protein